MSYLNDKIDMHREMLDALDLGAIGKAAEIIATAYKRGGKLLIFGNGGSAADAMHFAAEFEGQLSSRDKGRRALSALTPANLSALTAISNDFSYDDSFSRFVEANARQGDIVVGISTSGNSRNVISAINAAKRAGATTVALTGGDGGQLGKMADAIVNVPAHNVSIIQEGHVIIYHRICALVIKDLFGYDAMV